MKQLAYLSGAPRVSTADAAEAVGPRSHVLGVIGGFERAGWQVDRYIAGDQRWAGPFARSGAEAAVRKARWRGAVTDGLRMTIGAYNARAAVRRVPTADLAYERFGSFQSLGRPFQRRGIPWVLETSGPFFHEAKRERGTLVLTGPARRHELAAYRDCDLLVCVSETLRDWLIEAGVSDGHLTVAPNGVDIHRFDPSPYAAVAPRSDELVVGFIGVVHAWQGLETLVEAVATLRAGSVPVVAQIVGDGPALEELRALAVERGVADAVRFGGRVPAGAVPAHIAGFDVGFSGHLPLLDGRMYHSPLKLYEYLAMGKPLIAADHAEARRLVKQTGAGHLFPAGDPDALAAVLAAAADDLPAVRSAGWAMRSHVVAEHSWDRRVADLLAEVERRGL